MAVQAYMIINGTKQGAFKGESKNPKRAGWSDVLALQYELITPRDTETGQASGKRQHNPLVSKKQWGAATPQLFQALATNEALEAVTFEFEKIGPDARNTCTRPSGSPTLRR
jgi:type VI secretion system secreted protein Hcp